ncbi:sugar-phosphatase [Dyadobacter jejuensis]|uniref:Sugar-phosphatase n=2 Tax=Dyadobacter jejuensis TaxID=1082580 RepID=A0A316AAP6_9BACT|nr:sugar-phosphatase [Dyadobacter jejuensis]
MDGLLIDSEPIWLEAAQHTMRKINFKLTEELKQQTTGLACQLFLEYCHKIQPWDTPTFDEMEAEIISYAHAKILSSATAMPGAIDLVKDLHRRGMPLAVASASHMELIEGVLDRLSLRQYFTTWHSGTLEEFTKPHPAVYLSTALKLGVPPQACLAIEDSHAGLQSARSAGMTTISVPAPEVFHHSKFEIADFKLASLAEFDFASLVEVASNRP